MTFKPLHLVSVVLLLPLFMIAPRDAVAADGQIERALEKKATIDFNKTPLKDAALYIGERYDIPVRLMPEAGPLTPITLKVAGVKLKDALRMMLDPYELEYAVADDTLVIRSKVKKDK